jgi:hypothetical protein
MSIHNFYMYVFATELLLYSGQFCHVQQECHIGCHRAAPVFRSVLSRSTGVSYVESIELLLYSGQFCHVQQKCHIVKSYS